jgi:hypothetical protein
MQGTRMAEGLTPEQLAEAQRNFEVLKRAAEEHLWRIACLMAGKPDRELLGRTEFEVREHVLRIGARAIETPVNGRNKARTAAPPPCAPTKAATRHCSSGGTRPS